MTTIARVLVASAMCAVGVSQIARAESEILAPGEPPLTRDVAVRFGRYLQWALDVSFRAEDTRFLEGALTETWRRGEMRDVLEDIRVYEQQLLQLPPAELELARLQIGATIVTQLAVAPGNPISKWAIGLHSREHPPIAPGAPPLTRDTAVAVIDFVSFAVAETTGQPVQLDRAVREQWVRDIAREYPTYGAEKMQQLAQMPYLAAALPLMWPQLSPEQQAQLREGWSAMLAAEFAPSAPPAPSGRSVSPEATHEMRWGNVYTSQMMSLSNSMTAGSIDMGRMMNPP